MNDRRHAAGDQRQLSSVDKPPNSRLFVIGSKQLTEDDFREAFSKFGEIEEIWVVKDRQTGERKGYAYIKFSKTSEAAKALEAMNGKTIGSTNRHIKVVIASRRDQGSKREENEDEKVQRLFVLVPKTMTEEELYDYFKQFGDIDYTTVVRDRDTKESKGFAYVKYLKFSHAATAFEQCEKKYKAVFAEPRSSKRSTNNDYLEQSTNNYPSDNNYSNFESFNKSNTNVPNFPLPKVQNEGYNKLIVITSPALNQDQLWKLFDIVPGLDYCQLKYEGRQYPVRGIGNVVYNTPHLAAYARQKFHGFEYPPGCRLIVKPDFDGRQCEPPKTEPPPPVNPTISQPDIKQLAETIAQATSLIQAAGLTQLRGASKESNWSVSLPDPKPLLHVDDPVAARCFIVCTPHPLPPQVLKDVFCRFGNLIEVYMLQHRNCGYAKYGSKESADNAIKTLHGADIGDVRLKVMEAEEPRDNQRKRLKLEMSE